jgi:carbon monoxide dehydrogenase subunit G
MKIAGSYTLTGPREKIWPLIYDPAALMNLIPGCEQLEQINPTEYRGKMQLRFPGVAGVYHTYVKILERDEPHFSRFEGEVNGPAGSVKGTASFELKDAEERQTVISYQGQAMITGALAKLSPRFVEGVAQTLLKQGLAALDQQVQQQAAVTPVVVKTAPHSFIRRLIHQIKILLWNRA